MPGQATAAVQSTTRSIPVSNLGPANTFPKYSFQFRHYDITPDDSLSEGELDGFFYDGHVPLLPYTSQDTYDRAQTETELPVITLENDLMKAIVYPQYGGRVASLYDKVADRELLFDNPVWQPANLAIRNAWFSGGIEWNAPLYGHMLLTCSDVYVARVVHNGQEGLRIYEFDRALETAFQVDLILDNEKPRLWVHVKTFNVSKTVVDYYWWTNIAVKAEEKTRVLANTTDYGIRHTPDQRVFRRPFPHLYGEEGADCSYPSAYPGADSIFFCMKQDDMPWLASVDEQGQGILYTSTRKLCGRKFFVWGENVGAHKWTDLLAQPGKGKYIELQGGLRPTQLQTLPMQPGEVFEWTECIEGLDMDAADAQHEDYQHPLQLVQQKVTDESVEALIEHRHQEFVERANQAIEENLWKGSAWGRIFETQTGSTISPSMTFDADPSPGEQVWLDLSEGKGFGSDDEVGDWCVSDKWIDLLRKEVEAGKGTWRHHLHIATALIEREQIDEGLKHLAESNSEKENAFAWRAIGLMHVHNGNMDNAREAYARAIKVGGEHIEIALEYSRLLYDNGHVADAKSYVEALSPEMQSHERIMILQAEIALGEGDYDTVNKVLEHEFGGIRETEDTLTDLWFAVQIADEEKRRGREMTEDEKASLIKSLIPPAHIDFRMLTDE